MLRQSQISQVIDYISYMRDAYLIDSIGLYNDSLHVTARNPKKVYAYDTGLANSVSLSRSPYWDRLLENYVFIALRHHHEACHIFYEQGKGECDFVVTDNSNRPVKAIQVCYALDDDNFKHEMDGLTEAMRTFGLKEGLIVTYNEEDVFNTDEGVVRVVKAWQAYDIL